MTKQRESKKKAATTDVYIALQYDRKEEGKGKKERFSGRTFLTHTTGRKKIGQGNRKISKSIRGKSTTYDALKGCQEKGQSKELINP